MSFMFKPLLFGCVSTLRAVTEKKKKTGTEIVITHLSLVASLQCSIRLLSEVSDAGVLTERKFALTSQQLCDA